MPAIAMPTTRSGQDFPVHATKPPRDQYAGIRHEIVEAESGRGAHDHSRYRRHHDHDAGKRLGAAQKTPHGVSEYAGGKDEQQDSRHLGGCTFLARRAPERKIADDVDRAVRRIVEGIGDEGARIRGETGRRERHG